MLLFSILSLTSMFFSHNIFMLIISSFAVGFTSIIPQLIIPLAAQLSDPKERGRIIGTVMSGLLIGILVSRTVSGTFGWLLWLENSLSYCSNYDVYSYDYFKKTNSIM